jgi:hypothetical protein
MWPIAPTGGGGGGVWGGLYRDNGGSVSPEKAEKIFKNIA